MHNNKNGEKEIGESWSYLGVSTFVPISVVKKAEEAIKGLDTTKRDNSIRKGCTSCMHCGKS